MEMLIEDLNSTMWDLEEAFYALDLLEKFENVAFKKSNMSTELVDYMNNNGLDLLIPEFKDLDCTNVTADQKVILNASVVDAIKAGAGKVWDLIVSLFKKIGDLLSGFVDMIGKAFDSTKELFNKVWKTNDGDIPDEVMSEFLKTTKGRFFKAELVEDIFKTVAKVIDYKIPDEETLVTVYPERINDTVVQINLILEQVKLFLNSKLEVTDEAAQLKEMSLEDLGYTGKILKKFSDNIDAYKADQKKLKEITKSFATLGSRLAKKYKKDEDSATKATNAKAWAGLINKFYKGIIYREKKAIADLNKIAMYMSKNIKE